MFAYPDAARYRLGVNYQQLPCNRPVCPVYSPYERDGSMNTTSNYGSDPNYVNSAIKPVKFKSTTYGASGSTYTAGGDGGKHELWVHGAVEGYASDVTDEDFVQPRDFWDNVLGIQPGQQDHFVENVAAHLGKALPAVQKRSLRKST